VTVTPEGGGAPIERIVGCPDRFQPDGWIQLEVEVGSYEVSARLRDAAGEEVPEFASPPRAVEVAYPGQSLQLYDVDMDPADDDR
jgi:hypothetical protein